MFLINGVGFFCDLASVSGNFIWEHSGTIGSHIMSQYVPKGLRKLNDQFVLSNKKGNYYFVCYKVINRFYSYNKKSERWNCFHEKVYKLF